MPEMGKAIEETVREFSEKLKKGALPPDPLRIVEFGLSGIPAIEHALILPPFIETIHSEVTEPAVEKAPRLPLTGDFPVKKWKEYKVE